MPHPHYRVQERFVDRGYPPLPRTGDIKRKMELYDRDEGTCTICNTALPNNLFPLQYDHLFPQSLRYRRDIFATKEYEELIHSNYNLRLVHKPCNSRRSKWITQETAKAAGKNLLLLNEDNEISELHYNIINNMLFYVVSIGFVNVTMQECEEKDSPTVEHAEQVYERLGIPHQLDNYARESWVRHKMRKSIKRYYHVQDYPLDVLKNAYLSGNASNYARQFGLNPRVIQSHIRKLGFHKDKSMVPAKQHNMRIIVKN